MTYTEELKARYDAQMAAAERRVKRVQIIETRGAFHLVGNVPITLAYTMEDGSPLTDRAIEAIRHCGPGFAKVKAVRFETREAAQAAIDRVI